MQTYLVIENGIVVNAIIWDGNEETWTPPVDHLVVLKPQDSNAWIGWHYDGVEWTAGE